MITNSNQSILDVYKQYKFYISGISKQYKINVSGVYKQYNINVLGVNEQYKVNLILGVKCKNLQVFLNSIKLIIRCSSHIGRQGGAQDVSLATDCLKKGTAIHELMHVLGFFHEQSRPDRDSWVRVIYFNIIPGTYRYLYIPVCKNV